MGKLRTIQKPANFDRYLSQEGLTIVADDYVRRLEVRVSNLSRVRQSLNDELGIAQRVLSHVKPRQLRKARKAAGLS